MTPTPHTIRTPRTATVREVGLRDGLQSVATVVNTADKCAWVDAAYAAGVREIEVLAVRYPPPQASA